MLEYLVQPDLVHKLLLQKRSRHYPSSPARRPLLSPAEFAEWKATAKKLAAQFTSRAVPVRRLKKIMVRGRTSAAASNQFTQLLLLASGSGSAQAEQHVGTEVCAAEFKASDDAALNSLGSESGQRQQHTSQNFGSIDSMEKGRTSGAAHKSSKGKSSSKGERASLSPEQYLVIKRQEAVEKVMAAFNKKLADELAIITHAYESSGGASGGSSYGGSGGGLNSGGGSAGRSSGRGKRQFDDGERNESSSGDGNGGNGHDKGGNKRAKTDEDGPSFVCPFFRHDPKRFCHLRTCVGPGWKTIHRLKEHLYRNHRLPNNPCPRCGDPFGDAKALNAHLRSDNPCCKKDIAAAQGIDEQQEKKLRERKRVGSAVTDEQRWRDIYMILFPEANKNNLPSPYYDMKTDAEEYAKTGQHFMKYKKRIEKELPVLIRKKVEQQFAHVGEELIANFDAFVRDGIQHIFNCPTPNSASAPGSPRSCLQSPAPTTPGTSSPPKSAMVGGGGGELGFDTSGEGLDFSFLDDPDPPYMLLNGLDVDGFDFGSVPADCLTVDAESDSGYASTATISQQLESG
ncbi:Protein kinase domain-containing protein, partial [Apiospora sp. TS-2023a]